MNTKQRSLILFTVCLSTFMATIDGSIVNISLPVIAQQLSVSISAIQWVVTSYLVTISAFLLIWGKLSDLYSRKLLFIGGFMTFTIGSLLCSLSGSLPMLVFSRVVQALGASITMALVQGIVTLIFPANERGKALGMIATVVAMGSLVGPSLGGLLVHFWGWQSIFTINLPIGLFGMLMAWRYLPGKETETSANTPMAFDYFGAATFSTAIIIFFLALLSYQDGVISLSVTLLLTIIALLLLTFFLKHEKRASNPLLDLKIFHNWEFSSGVLTLYIFFLSMFAYTFFMPFYLQKVRQLDVLSAGMLMSLYPMTTGLCSPLFGRLSDRMSYKPLTIIGQSLNALGLCLLAFAGSSAPLPVVGGIIVLLGLGASIFQSPNTSSIMGAVQRTQVGVAGSINAFFRNFGMVTGTTLSVLLFTTVTQVTIEALSGTTINSSNFLFGFKVVMLTAATLALSGACLSYFRGGTHVHKKSAS